MDKMRISLILVVITIIIIGTTCFAATGSVNAPSGLVLRDSASKDGDPITTVGNNETVEILETLEDWYKVKYGEDEGYLYKQYVNVTEEEEPEETTVEEQEESQETTTEAEETETTTVTQEVKEVYPKEATTLKSGKVYIMPSITSTSINSIEAEITVTITKGYNTWVYVTSQDGISGWMRRSVVEIAETTESEEEPEEEETQEEEEQPEETTFEERKGYVNVTSSANVRDGASSSASVVTTLSRNTEINVVGESGEWYKITYGSISGSISKSLVSDTKLEETSRSTVERGTNEITEQTESSSESTAPAPTPSTGSVGGQQVADLASQYIGYSYVYGGSSPSGFDCSGFAQYIFSSCGYSIGRTCSAQIGYGTAVSKSELVPGDLIFFNNTSDGSIGHVGIYVGDGKIVHAANSRRGVTTDTINSGYYNTYYYAARRIAY